MGVVLVARDVEALHYLLEIVLLWCLEALYDEVLRHQDLHEDCVRLFVPRPSDGSAVVCCIPRFGGRSSQPFAYLAVGVLLKRIWNSHAFRVGRDHYVLNLHEVLWYFFEQDEAEVAEEVWEVVEED